MEAIRSSETSVQSTISTRRRIPEDGILHSALFVFSALHDFPLLCMKTCFPNVKQTSNQKKLKTTNRIQRTWKYGLIMKCRCKKKEICV
jgi:hypothetical protein